MSSRVTIERFLHRYVSGEYFAALVNHPVPHRLRQPPELVYHATLNPVAARFTVVMPTFNHEPMMSGSLAATADAATMPFDCIIVDDGSEDRTIERARSFFESRRSALVARATIVRNPVPVYETACDNIGFALTDTEVIVEVQADIQVREPGFDALCVRALETSPTPSALSGRCGHGFALLRPRSPLSGLFGSAPDKLIGLCGKTIETPGVVDPIRGRLFRCETVNRGPWVLRRSDLERHGFLDERHFFQGNDDHDYHRRLFQGEGRRPLYVPMALHAPLAWGAFRRKRTGVNREVFNMLKAEKRGSSDFHAFLASIERSPAPERIA
jgi:glycosyltransferase involved in cell wall biosynthesis